MALPKFLTDATILALKERGIERPLLLARRLAKKTIGMTGKIYPSGRFSLAWSGSKPKKPKDLERNYGCESAVWNLSQKDEFPRIASPRSEVACLSELPRIGTEVLPDLGSSDSAISRKRAKRGSRGITPRQSDLVRWGLKSLEVREGKDKLSFLTLTIPSVSDEYLELIQRGWSEIVRRVVEEIKRLLLRRGIETPIIGCTEIQEKRSNAESRVIPHLHLVFVGRSSKRSNWAVKPTEFRQIFRRVVESICGVSDYSYVSCENVQRVKLSAYRYLSKYLSKGSRSSLSSRPDIKWFPHSWVVVSRSIRSSYVRLTISGRDVAEYLLAEAFDPSNSKKVWKRPIEIESSIGWQTIGWFGFLLFWEIPCPAAS